MTLLNIHESQRFKKGAFRFWGCLPVYKTEAATNAGTTPNKASKRCVEVHQAGLHVVLEAIRELCAAAPYKFANGEVYTGEVRLAFFMGDHCGSLLITCISDGKARDAECVQLRMSGA